MFFGTVATADVGNAYQGLSDHNTQWHAHIDYYILASFCLQAVIKRNAQ